MLRDIQCSYLLYKPHTTIESKHKAYHIFLQAIAILNTENFINIAMGYRSMKVRDVRVKPPLTQLMPSSCMQLSCIY